MKFFKHREPQQGFRALFATPALRRTLMVGVGVQVINQLVGINTVGSDLYVFFNVDLCVSLENQHRTTFFCRLCTIPEAF